MSRTKLLLDVGEDLRNLADSIQTLCDAVMSDEPQAAPTIDGEYVQHKNPEVTLEEVRGLLARKSQEGKSTEVKSLIEKFGASRLSEIKPESYHALMLDAEEL